MPLRPDLRPVHAPLAPLVLPAATPLQGAAALVLRHALLLPPIAGVALGLLLPPMAAMARQALPVTAALNLAVLWLLAEPGRPTMRELAGILALTACNLLGTPLLVLCAAAWAGFDPRDAATLALPLAAPVASAAVLTASLTGLPVRPLLLAQLLGFLLLPATAPLVAGAVVDPGLLLPRILLLVLLPTAAGLLARVALGPARSRAGAMQARALSSLGLACNGLCVGDGLLVRVLGDPSAAAALAGGLALSFSGAALLGALAARLARLDPRSFACGAGARNVTLLWAASDHALPPSARMAFQLALGWAFALPALVALLRRRR